jgi:hypothetical protein
MKFIFADCLDYVDPNYDFESDSSPAERKPYWDDQFPHEIMGKAPYDGILVSRGVVGDHLFKGKYTESQSMRFRRVGAREFLRFNRPEDKDKWVFGDSGAFQYVNLPEPPYTPTDMSEFYFDGGFTHGCSIDHIIYEFDTKLKGLDLPNDSEIAEDCKKRFEITLENAEGFLNESRQICKSFTPMGAVQGWSPDSMAEAASQLVKMGYSYLAIGGLVPLGTEDIHKALTAIFDKIGYSSAPKIHLLGFEKANLLDQFIGKYPITSIDTTAPLTKAFKDDKKNYYINNGKGGIEFYTSIRIPQATDNPVLKRAVQSGLFNQEEIISLEQKALKSLRKYAKRVSTLEETLETILNYSKTFLVAKKTKPEKLQNALDKLSDAYRRTLTDRPWELCSCPICKACSIEVIIFRASNRNKRRGIHNLKTFYDHLKEKRG